MTARRTALGAAIAVLLVLAVVALVARDGSRTGQLTLSEVEPSTTEVLDTTTTVVATTAATSTTVPAATATTSPAATPATAFPTTEVAVPTTRAQGEQLKTVAGGHGSVQAALKQARDRWAAAKPARGYTWSYRNDCFCTPRKLQVDVDGGGRVTAVRAEDGTTPLPLDRALSVDAAFAELQSAIDANVASIAVRFDSNVGFPSSYYVDRSERLADEEHGITVLTYTPRS